MPKIAGIVYDDQVWKRAESIVNQAYANLVKEITGEANNFGEVCMYVPKERFIEKIQEIYKSLEQQQGCQGESKRGGA